MAQKQTDLLEENNNQKEKIKEKRIEEEMNRIAVFYAAMDENQKSLVIPLIQNCAFMKVTLEDLQEIINSEGVVDKYQNGANQYGLKQSATLQSYNSLIKNYSAVIKTLSTLLPPKRRSSLTPSLRVPTQEEQEAERQRQKKLQQEREAEFSRADKYQKLRNAGYDVGTFGSFDPEDWREALATV